MAETEVLEERKFEIVVPYNNEVLLSERKRSKLTGGIILIIASLVLIGLAIGYVLSSNAILWLVVVVGVLAAFTLCGALYSFFTIKPRQKDENKTVSFYFYEDGLKVCQNKDLTDAKVKTLENCLYRPYKNKQYVANIVEREDRFVISIYTGTYNGVPQYKKHSIPKSVLGEEISVFTDFLKEKVGKDYRIKIKDKSDLENLTNAN